MPTLCNVAGPQPESAHQAAPTPGPRGRMASPAFLWPVLAALGLFLAIVGICSALDVRRNGGQFIYAVDDVYMHMAMAKNFVRHGVWGLPPYGYTSCTSSPFFTFLLSAAYYLTGVREITLMVINTALGCVLLVVCGRVLQRSGAGGVLNFGTLAGIVLLAPMIATTLCGLEHNLHALLTVTFAWLATCALTSAAPRPRAETVLLTLTAMLLPVVRYEGLFPVALFCGLYLLRGRWRAGIVLGLLTLIPISLYGLLSVSKGWFFVPNSVLLKGQAPVALTLSGITGFALTSYTNLMLNPHLLTLVLGAVVLFYVELKRTGTFWTRPAILLAVFILTTLLHMQFARVNSYFRYEAYLVVFGLLAAGVAWAARPSRVRDPATDDLAKRPATWLPRLAGASLLLLFGLSLGLRGRDALLISPLATTNIYEQQYQMGRFLKEFYPDAAVAANDIGVITYKTDIHLLDLWGLASMEVARAKRQGVFNTQKISEMAKANGVKIAMTYSPWFEAGGGLPRDWINVGQWRVRNNVVLGGELVDIFAVDPAEAPRLAEHLRRFSNRLPPGVEQTGMYLQAGEKFSITTNYQQEKHPDGSSWWWSSREASVFFSTTEAEAGDYTMTMPIQTSPKVSRLNFFLDDQPVKTEQFFDGSERGLAPVSVPVHLTPGRHFMRIVGEGEPYHPWGDGRDLLFQVRVPSLQRR